MVQPLLCVPRYANRLTVDWWVQDRGHYRASGVQAVTSCLELWVESQPFLVPEDVILGIEFTGPHILVVNLI